MSVQHTVVLIAGFDPLDLEPVKVKRVILACGSRTWTDRQKVWNAYYAIGDEWGLDLIRDRDWQEVGVAHGGARGADHIAGSVAMEFGMQVKEYPADWQRHGKAAGVIRNLEMLNAKPDIVLAFWDGKSRGTAHTIREAEKLGIPVRVISPERSS